MKEISTLLFILKNFNGRKNKSTVINLKPEREMVKTESTVYSPSVRTINNIMNFASAYEVLETETTGCVEMILN